jgi:glucose/arabinose dehydrogenase
MRPAVTLLSMALIAPSALTLAAYAEEPFDIQSQVGPNPVLPDIQQYLFPPMHLSSVVGWKNGETPTVAAGLKIESLATGLQHPRSLYTLPNGDVLVVESKAPPPQPITRPKDIVMRFIEKGVTSGGDPGPSNRITLLRYDAAGGKPPTRSVFLDHLHSPFGVVLVGDDLYVANTDAIVRYPYHTGDLTISADGATLTPLPGGPIDHHWTKSLTASRDGSLLYVGVGSNSNITENGIEAEKDRAAIWEVDRATGRWRIFASGLRNPNGLTFEPESGALWTVVNERDELGPNLVPDYPDFRERRRVLRMALQLLRPAPRSARAATAPGFGREGHHSRLRAKLARGPAWPRFLHRRQLASEISRRRVCRRTRKLEPVGLQRV